MIHDNHFLFSSCSMLNNVELLFQIAGQVRSVQNVCTKWWITLFTLIKQTTTKQHVLQQFWRSHGYRSWSCWVPSKSNTSGLWETWYWSYLGSGFFCGWDVWGSFRTYKSLTRKSSSTWPSSFWKDNFLHNCTNFASEGIKWNMNYILWIDIYEHEYTCL